MARRGPWGTGETMDLPDFIERGGDLVHPQPFLHQGVRLHGFFVRASRRRLQALVAHALPPGDAPRFEVLGEHVLLTVAVIPKITSTDPQGRTAGWASEIDVAFWIPVALGTGRQRVIDWYIPYIFVDNPYAMAIGRESYGFPKALGSFSLPRALLGEHAPLFAPLGTTPSADDGYHVDVIGLSARHPEVRAERLRLFSLVPAGPASAGAPLGVLRGLAPLLGHDPPHPRSLPTTLAQLRRAWLDRGLSIVFLRQLRDAARPHQASYQELLRAPARVARLRGGGLLPQRHALRIRPCASHPIAAELGIEDAVVEAGFWVDFDFVMEKGERVAEHAAAPARPRRKQKIAILGGGMGALATALSLTEQPNWRDELELTIYQTGWRLGGKCASSRNPSEGGRIEEHGLHLWFGCYENAFRMIRRCYEELARPASHPMATWRHAFTPEHRATLHQHDGSGAGAWTFAFPPNDAAPGDAAREGFGRLAVDVAAWLRSALREAAAQQPVPQRLVRCAVRLAHAVEQAAFSVDGLRVLTRRLRPAQVALLRGALRRLMAHRGTALHRQWQLLDLGLTVLHGMLRDRVMTRGLRAIDHEDLRQWLARHGAAAETIDAAPVRVLYDLAFAYEDGDPARPNLAAGTGLQIIFRLCFDYRGAFMWKMQAGMGETVITPIYEVLRRRGVRFAFFHHAKRIELSPDRGAVSCVRLSRQATVRAGEYEPLVEIDGHGCWPEHPRHEQLVEGEALRGRDLEHEPAELEEVCLHAGRDFDAVVLAIPVGALPEICAPLAAALPSWRAMLSHLETNATIAAQLWSTAPPHERFLQGNHPGVLSTCADMTHLLASERWPAADPPRSLAYLCGAFPSDGDAEAILADFTRHHAGSLWQGAAVSTSVYLRVNEAPSERYTLSLAGTGRHRLAPGGAGVEGLFLAGDWTDNGINVGCIEATVVSGMQCARAITGRPRWIYGERWAAGEPLEPPAAVSVPAADRGLRAQSVITSSTVVCAG